MYCDERVEQARSILTNVPLQVLTIIASTRSLDVNLRSACVDELCLRDVNLDGAVELREWAKYHQKRCEFKADLWWHFDEFLYRIGLKIDYLEVIENI